MFEAIGRFLDTIFAGCLKFIVTIVVICLAISVVVACPMLIVILLLLGILCKLDKQQ